MEASNETVFQLCADDAEILRQILSDSDVSAQTLRTLGEEDMPVDPESLSNSKSTITKWFIIVNFLLFWTCMGISVTRCFMVGAEAPDVASTLVFMLTVAVLHIAEFSLCNYLSDCSMDPSDILCIILGFTTRIVLWTDLVFLAITFYTIPFLSLLATAVCGLFVSCLFLIQLRSLLTLCNGYDHFSLANMQLCCYCCPTQTCCTRQRCIGCFSSLWKKIKVGGFRRQSGGRRETGRQGDEQNMQLLVECGGDDVDSRKTSTSTSPTLPLQKPLQPAPIDITTDALGDRVPLGVPQRFVSPRRREEDRRDGALMINTSVIRLPQSDAQVLHLCNCASVVDLWMLVNVIKRHYTRTENYELVEFNFAILALARCFMQSIVMCIIKFLFIVMSGLNEFVLFSLLLDVCLSTTSCMYHTIDPSINDDDDDEDLQDWFFL
eukprot:Platyproteum_vivax@DN4283_c0_g1_i2.p1